LSALDAIFKDVRYMLPFITQLWMFVTPVVYPLSMIPASYRPWAGLNPMAGVVEGFRWSLLGAPLSSPRVLVVSAGVTVVLLVTGAIFLRRIERDLADHI
jgi:lipopolysaccharide transport system permease protein